MLKRSKGCQTPSRESLYFALSVMAARVRASLRTFARNFSNIDFFLKILPLKDDELAMQEM